jgi:hypothetical protein
MQLSRRTLGASFAAVTIGGALLALAGVAFISFDNPPLAAG